MLHSVVGDENIALEEAHETFVGDTDDQKDAEINDDMTIMNEETRKYELSDDAKQARRECVWHHATTTVFSILYLLLFFALVL